MVFDDQSDALLIKDIDFSIRDNRGRPGTAQSTQSFLPNGFTVGDIGLIQRVLENLVRNAIRFTPDGGTVTLSIAERPQSMTVAVTDTGAGISDRDIPRIFDRFYRAVQGEEAQSDSSGLGLAIVKRILDLHNSRITVESKIDFGTKFEFDLPLFKEAA